LPTASSLTTFLKNNLLKFLQVVLFPAEGEGRNAIYAAHGGMLLIKVSRVKESKTLANKHDVAINYEVGEFQSIGYQENQFDAIVLIYAHFPADKKSSYHKI
jgi:hypothetical protein